MTVNIVENLHGHFIFLKRILRKIVKESRGKEVNVTVNEEIRHGHFVSKDKLSISSRMGFDESFDMSETCCYLGLNIFWAISWHLRTIAPELSKMRPWLRLQCHAARCR